MDPDEDVPPGKVKLTCHSCGARYLVPEGKVRGRRFRASCKRCGGIIVARYDKGSFTVLPESGGDNRRAKRPSAALRLQSSDLAEDRGGDDGWYVVIAGEPRGPFTPDQINEELAAGRITERNYAWREGEPDWVRLQDIEALAGGTHERTGFYAPEDAPPMRREPTSETIAGGPKGRRPDEEHPDFYHDDPTYGAADVGASDGYDPHYHEGDGQETYGGYREEDDYDGRATGYYDGGGAEQGYPAFDDRPEHSAEATRLHDTAQRQDLPIRPARTGEVRDPDRWSREVDVKAWGGQPGKIQGEQVGQAVGQAGRYARTPESPVEEPWPDDMSEPRLWASPRRPAALPAPPGARRAVIPAPAPPPPPGAGLPPSSDYTRPLSQEEQRHVAAPGPPAFAGAPAFTPPPAQAFSPPSAPLPPPSAFGGSAFGAARSAQPENSDLLPSLVPAVPASSMAPPKLLLPTKEPFWSVGKIVLATAIGSALLICLTVGIVAIALRSRGPKVATRLPSSAQGENDRAGDDGDPPETPAKPQMKNAAVAPPTPAPAPAPAPQAKTAPTPTPTVAPTVVPTPTPAPIPDVQVAPTPAPKAVRKVARRTARRPARKVRRRSYRPRRRTARRARAKKDDVDALIGGGGGGSSADDVLAAAGGSRKARKPKRRPAPAAAADDVLAAASGGGGGGGKPRALTESQIVRVMRRLSSHVRGCFDTHKQPGTLKLKVTIRPNGRATGRTTGRFAGSPTARCVERAVPRLRFPAISGPATRITYPFLLK